MNPKHKNKIVYSQQSCARDLIFVGMEATSSHIMEPQVCFLNFLLGVPSLTLNLHVKTVILTVFKAVHVCSSSHFFRGWSDLSKWWSIWYLFRQFDHIIHVYVHIQDWITSSVITNMQSIGHDNLLFGTSVGAGECRSEIPRNLESVIKI